MNQPQRVLITGASGFLGRHLLDGLKEKCRIFALGRRTQALCGAPVHPNITWHQVDIRDRDGLTATFSRIRDLGGIDVLIHLAAHYDFGTANDKRYWQTNVDGLGNILEEARLLRPAFLIFASSLAACGFPRPGGVVDEFSQADGRHIYAKTKREGERMVQAYGRDFPCCIVRFAAMFSDWCEYPPMFVAFRTWLSRSWRRRIVGGRGDYAIPYLHVLDAVQFLILILEHHESIEPAEILLATTDDTVPISRLYREVTALCERKPKSPVRIPRPFCVAGIYARDALGRLLGKRPFEQPWMARYIDRQLVVNSALTRERLGWEPRPRLKLLRRLPFLIENLKTNPVEWNRRNHAAMQKVEISINLRTCRLLEKHDEAIRNETTERILEQMQTRTFPGYQRLSRERSSWLVQVALRHLINSVRTREKAVYSSYCRDLAERSFALGFSAEEVCESQRLLCEMCLRALASDPSAPDLGVEPRRQISMTIMFGCDQIVETYERIEESWKEDSSKSRQLQNSEADITPHQERIGRRKVRIGDE